LSSEVSVKGEIKAAATYNYTTLVNSARRKCGVRSLFCFVL